MWCFYSACGRSVSGDIVCLWEVKEMKWSAYLGISSLLNSQNFAESDWASITQKYSRYTNELVVHVISFSSAGHLNCYDHCIFTVVYHHFLSQPEFTIWHKKVIRPNITLMRLNLWRHNRRPWWSLKETSSTAEELAYWEFLWGYIQYLKKKIAS